MRSAQHLLIMIGLLLLALLTPALAQLSVGAVAPSDEVEVFVYAGRDATLIRKHVDLALVAGENAVEFAWRELTIDPRSISVRLDGGPSVSATTFPADRPGSVVFTVDADRGGFYSAQVAYMCTGLSSQTRYRAVLAADQSTLDLVGYIQLTNTTQDQFENAKMCVVAGDVMLDDVRMMAETKLIPDAKPADPKVEAERAAEKAEQDKATPPPPKPDNPWDLPALGGLPQPPQRIAAPKLTPESGSPEYWVYPADGLRTLGSGEARQFDFFRATDIPVRSMVRFDRAKYGDVPRRILVLKNDAESGLGLAPIPPGPVWVLTQGMESMLPVADAQVKHATIGDEIELDIGVERGLVVEREMTTYELTAISYDPAGQISGYDQHEEYTLSLRNVGGTPLSVELVEEIQGVWEMRTIEPYEKTLDNTAVFKLELAPGEARELVFRLIKHNGTRVRG